MRRSIIKTCITEQLRSETKPLQVCAHSINFSIFLFTLIKSAPCTWLMQTRTFTTSSDEKHKYNRKSLTFSSSSASFDEIKKPHRDFSTTHSRRYEKANVQNLLLELSHISPETIRPFWRKLPAFNTHDFCHILLTFENFHSGKPKSKTTESVTLLWKLFNSDFKDHLPRSYEIMLLMLIQEGLLKEAESLFRTTETHGVVLPNQVILGSKIIESNVIAGDLEKSISMYNWIRARALVPSQPCFQLLLRNLIEMKKPQLAFQLYRDMVDLGIELNYEDMATFEFVTKLLCKEGKVQEARSLVKKVTAAGFEPSCEVVDTIADAHCEKKDFDDLLSFLDQRRCAPRASVCNKIISYQCRDFGMEQAYSFMAKLERLGFSPDEVTFGMFIRWSCRDMKLRDAFMYLSELVSRGLKPDLHSYNALISGVFKKGMWKHANEVFNEMLERDVTPDLSTFRILLAGYCKFKQFDEAKAIVREMMNRNLVQLSSLEDPLSKAFDILGFKPSSVKVKRDNDAGLWKAEFFDTLGNGLYLETDLDEYEKTVTRVLEDAFFLDSNSIVLAECDHGNVKAALMVKDNMECHGEKLSFSAYSALVKCVLESHSRVTKAFDLLEEMPELANQLDQTTLNVLIRVIRKKGNLHKGKPILEMMLQKKIPIENEVYTALLMSLCKKRSPKELRECWTIARKNKWLPSLKDGKALVECLCQQQMLEEVLDLLHIMVTASVHPISDISIVFLEVLCDTGYTSNAQSFLEEVLGDRTVLDNIAYRHLIRGLCKEKKFQEALGLLDTMLTKDMTPCVDVYGQLIPQLCKSCSLDKCMVLKEIMLQKEPAACLSVYGSLINGLCKVKKIELATIQFQEMMVKGISPDIDMYNMMIQGHSQDKNCMKVWELLGAMVRKNIEVSLSSFRSLVSLMCECNRVSQVLNVKEFMLRQSKHSVVVYNILIFRLSQMGNSSVVKTVVQEMNMRGLFLDEATYNFLIIAYCKCKDGLKAMEVLEAMIEKDLRPSNRSLTALIGHLCYHGNLDKALELSRFMELRGWVQCSVQHEIVKGLVSHGRLLDAETFLKRMKEKDIISNNVGYDHLIKLFCWYGKLDVAVDLLNVSLKKRALPDPTSYDSIIQALCLYNAVDEALNFHAEMLVRNFKPSIRSRDLLIDRLCKNGQTAESERLLDSMLQLGQTPNRNMYQTVIDNYCSENKLNKASELLHKMQNNGQVPDFNTHWSLISNLSNSKNKSNTEGGGFLSNLLSLSGFTQKDTKTKVQ